MAEMSRLDWRAKEGGADFETFSPIFDDSWVGQIKYFSDTQGVCCRSLSKHRKRRINLSRETASCSVATEMLQKFIVVSSLLWAASVTRYYFTT